MFFLDPSRVRAFRGSTVEATEDYGKQMTIQGKILLALSCAQCAAFYFTYRFTVIKKESNETKEHRIASQKCRIYAKLISEIFFSILCPATALIYCGILGFKESVDSAIIVGILLYSVVSSSLFFKQLVAILVNPKLFGAKPEPYAYIDEKYGRLFEEDATR